MAELCFIRTEVPHPGRRIVRAWIGDGDTIARVVPSALDDERIYASELTGVITQSHDAPTPRHAIRHT